MKNKKFILVVQGEGRGHMTQALSLYDLLIERGNKVCCVVVGTSGRREIPSFFQEKIKSPLYKIPSPNFVTDKKNKSINIFKTLLHNLGRIRVFKESLGMIDKLVKEHEPDVIVNFFDLLIGMYFQLYKPGTKMVCIAHQYIYLHKDFQFPEGFGLDQMAIKFYTKLTSSRSSKNIALSFYKIHTHSNHVTITPPLLRREVFELEPVTNEHYLVYLVNNGYYEDIVEWHKKNTSTVLHCFTDDPQKLLEKHPYQSTNLFLHGLSDSLFLEMLSTAKGLASSAGFESVCEAMYLGKPVLMVPVEGHFEQFCNSRDAAKAGAGIFDSGFNLTRLVSLNGEFTGAQKEFRDWIKDAREKIYSEVVNV